MTSCWKGSQGLGFVGRRVPGIASSQWHQKTSTCCIQESGSKEQRERCDQNLGLNKQLQGGSWWLKEHLSSVSDAQVIGQEPGQRDLRHDCSISYCLVHCQIPSAEPVPGASQ